MLLLNMILLGNLLSTMLINDIVTFALTPLLCRNLHLRELEPRPFLLTLTLSCNANSATNLINNPQNILIGQTGGLDFWGYVTVTKPPALATMTIVYAVI